MKKKPKSKLTMLKTRAALLMNREEWLNRMTAAVAPLFQAADAPLPSKVRVSCGFPSKSALGKESKRIGECWTPKCSRDDHAEIFISPILADAGAVSAVLVHELIHAAVGVEEGHKGAFKRAALKLGLEGPMRSTAAGEELAKKLSALAKEVGPYPHAELKPNMTNGRKKQGTRLIKIFCTACEYTARTTKKWIDVGLPTCPCGELMVADDVSEDELDEVED